MANHWQPNGIRFPNPKSVVLGNNKEAQAFLSRGGQVIIRMRGLPYDASAKQVVSFSFIRPNSSASKKYFESVAQHPIQMIKFNMVTIDHQICTWSSRNIKIDSDLHKFALLRFYL